MERVGFAMGYDRRMGVREMAAWAREAEERGYEIAFFSETNNLMRDGVTAMAAFALATRRITLGFTQIVRLRSPVVMAQTLATLDELSGGRMILAPGACTKAQAANHGLPDADPPATLTEWVEVMRKILAGGRIKYHGQHVTLEDVGLKWTPPRPRVPFWIAAMSKTGLRLAARIGDGVLLNAVSSADYTRNAVRILREAVEEAGRDWDQFEVAQLINCSVADTHEEAVDAIRWEVAYKFRPPFRQVGPRTRVGEPNLDPEVLPVLEEAYRRGGDEALARAVPTSWVEAFTACGTPDEVRARVEEYRAAGVRLPILRPAAEDQARRLLDLFAPGEGAR
ncbi:MAG TPA: LLM class flavin-dependent oxidoreductase [Bacillota bacterium]